MVANSHLAITELCFAQFGECAGQLTSGYPIDGLLGVWGNGLVIHLSYLI